MRLLKAEGSALETRALIELTEGRMGVFQGRGGMEFTDVMRAGCIGMIASVEVLPRAGEDLRADADRRQRG